MEAPLRQAQWPVNFFQCEYGGLSPKYRDNAGHSHLHLVTQRNTDINASSGYDPIATVSNVSADLVKSYGAVKTFPYSSPTCGDAIKKETKGEIRHAIDCITTPESVQCCLKAIGRTGGRCVTLEYANDELKTRKAVKFDMVMAYVAFGKGVELPGAYHREPDMDKLYSASRWRNDVQELLDQGRIRCHPVREVSGGWEGIIKGLEMLKDGQVRGQKLVVRVG
jgi:NADPH:quinone reductase-like Zn-dependent oxidoreductase